jgi:hypothetical protein
MGVGPIPNVPPFYRSGLARCVQPVVVTYPAPRESCVRGAARGAVDWPPTF